MIRPMKHPRRRSDLKVWLNRVVVAVEWAGALAVVREVATARV